MHRIVFLDRDTVAPEVTIRRPAFPHEWGEHARTRPDEVAARAAGSKNTTSMPKARAMPAT